MGFEIGSHIIPLGFCGFKIGSTSSFLGEKHLEGGRAHPSQRAENGSSKTVTAIRRTTANGPEKRDTEYAINLTAT